MFNNPAVPPRRFPMGSLSVRERSARIFGASEEDIRAGALRVGMFVDCADQHFGWSTGEVVAVGPDVTRWRIGDRVTVTYEQAIAAAEAAKAAGKPVLLQVWGEDEVTYVAVRPR
jgi:hypothetical protein